MYLFRGMVELFCQSIFKFWLYIYIHLKVKLCQMDVIPKRLYIVSTDIKNSFEFQLYQTVV